MSKKNDTDKTNVMRVLDQKKIAYRHHCYIKEGEEPVTNGKGAARNAVGPTTNGVEVAHLLGEDVNRVFKTLVTIGRSGQHYVFMIPVAEELDLKKAAAAVSEKSIEMIPQKELLPLTGYVHGGCSPIGMKKIFPTTVHITAKEFDTILFSAGKIGYQVELSASDLEKAIRLQYAEIIK